MTGHVQHTHDKRVTTCTARVYRAHGRHAAGTQHPGSHDSPVHDRSGRRVLPRARLRRVCDRTPGSSPGPTAVPRAPLAGWLRPLRGPRGRGLPGPRPGLLLVLGLLRPPLLAVALVAALPQDVVHLREKEGQASVCARTGRGPSAWRGDRPAGAPPRAAPWRGRGTPPWAARGLQAMPRCVPRRRAVGRGRGSQEEPRVREGRPATGRSCFSERPRPRRPWTRPQRGQARATADASARSGEARGAGLPAAALPDSRRPRKQAGARGGAPDAPEGAARLTLPAPCS